MWAIRNLQFKKIKGENEKIIEKIIEKIRG